MKYNTPRFRVLTSAALLLAFLAAPVAAQPAPQSPAQPSQPQGARGLTHTNDAPVSVLPDKSKRYALIIGIDEYTADTNITRLNGAANDARAIANALITHAGFERDKVILLTSDQTDQTRQPVRNVILGALKNLKNLVEKDGMLVVAFSGHGVERQRDHQVFLLPAD
ncbi:MAG TPA: caspase family protein, partial [Pyrinomonadaceae bacterium]|nr:caspase family protein [Pyrinomonadaceae bacterium]